MFYIECNYFLTHFHLKKIILVLLYFSWLNHHSLPSNIRLPVTTSRLYNILLTLYHHSSTTIPTLYQHSTNTRSSLYHTTILYSGIKHHYTLTPLYTLAPLHHYTATLYHCYTTTLYTALKSEEKMDKWTNNLYLFFIYIYIYFFL